MLHGANFFFSTPLWDSAPYPAKGLTPFRIPFALYFFLEKSLKNKGILKGASPLGGYGAKPHGRHGGPLCV
ncbi:MAG TPA: hypothetical protein DCE71_03615 [Parachlamydiales bacterium]|nr:hypothetical protein [Parachlamydiales bacterium]